MEPADRTAGHASSAPGASSAPAPAGAQASSIPLPGDRVRDPRGLQASVVQPTISLDADPASVWLRLDQPESGRWVRLPLDLLVRSADGQYWCMAAFDTLVDASRSSAKEGMLPDPERVAIEPDRQAAAAAAQPIERAAAVAARPVDRVAGLDPARPAGQPHGAASVRSADAPLVIPVIEERLQVDKRIAVRGGLRLDKTIETRREVVDEPLMRDELSIERVPVNHWVSPEALPQVRHEGDTMVVPVFEEVLVVERRMLLKEELRIHRVRKEFHAPQAIELRREQVSVRRIDGDADNESPRVDPAAGSEEPVPTSPQPQGKGEKDQ